MEDKVAALVEQNKKVQKINGIKAELARLAEKHDDEVRPPASLRSLLAKGEADSLILSSPVQRRLIFQMDYFKLVTDYDPVVRLPFHLNVPHPWH